MVWKMKRRGWDFNIFVLKMHPHRMNTLSIKMNDSSAPDD